MPGAKYSVDLVRQNWQKNYRHQGGLSAVARCCLGMYKLLNMPALPEASASGHIDCVSFSVVPNLTRLWARLMARAVPDGNAKIWIGDCSGGFHTKSLERLPVRDFPLINYLHGWKLDLFFQKFIRSELFVVSDDDIFWLNDKPWRWAAAQFAQDPNLAVVSLSPRQRFKWELDGQEHQPMGSYCLVIRRDIWLKEQLSFQAVPEPSPSRGSYAGLYDTCDFANVELIKRGYRISIAPPHITSELAGFKGVSSAVLRIQKDPPEGYGVAYSDGPVPIVETCLIARQLLPILRHFSIDQDFNLLDPVLTERAEREMMPFLEPGKYEELQTRVSGMVKRISEALGIPAPATAAKAS